MNTEKDSCLIPLAYAKFIRDTFSEDERYDLKTFVEYFTEMDFHEHHHLEFNDSHIIVWSDLPESNVKVIEYLVVKESLRGMGKGTAFYREWAERHGNPKVMMEIENERTFRFWNRLGFSKVEGYKYTQPVLEKGKGTVGTLILSTNFDADTETTDKIVREWFVIGFPEERQ